ncbi:MAG: lysine biosynthesis protein LysX [bacterium]
MRIGILCSRVRKEEKLLLDAFESKGVDFVQIDDREVFFDLTQKRLFTEFDVVFDRSITYSHALYILKILADRGVPTVNTYDVVKVCGDKLLTSLILQRAGVPTPKVKVAYTAEAALLAADEMGYPCVVKPVVGSWGRLIAKLETRTAAEAVLEYKTTLGGEYHSIVYLQKYVQKPGRDLRIFVIGDEVVAGIYRSSEHWITNTARGGEATNCPITEDIRRIALAASRAVGGGILALDLFETDEGFLVNEINHTMEFRNSITTTGVNIPALMVDYVLAQGEKGKLLRNKSVVNSS